MINEAELKVKIFRLIDAQQGESLQDVYDWLSDKLQEKQAGYSLEQGCKNMADDREREQQAYEWIEETFSTDNL